MSIQFRKALPSDQPLLEHWSRQPHLAGTGADEDWGWEESLPNDPTWRKQLIATLDGKPIGFVQIIDPYEEETHYWGDIEQNLRAIDIWIGDAAKIGKGYGSTMMANAIHQCFSDAAVTGIVVDPMASNKKAHRFYERLGFRFWEPRTMHGSDVFLYRLDRSIWEKMSAPNC